MEYVIKLSSENEISSSRNVYGYWAGKTYKFSGEMFPVHDPRITSRTKRYTNKKRAESMARKLFDRCAYIMTWDIEHIKE